MENKYGIVGVAHIGLPTNDLQKTVEFYKSLGFEVIMQSYNEKAGEKDHSGFGRGHIHDSDRR